MRITTGLYKGRSIKTVNGLSVRPATDRVRQTIFNILANRMEMQGARVLDLFAGSGSLGLEALSRGAERAVFVENNSDAVHYLEMNVDALGCSSACEILETDAMRYVIDLHEQYDLVFADPPYAFERLPELPELLIGRGVVARGGYLVVEHSSDLRFPSAPPLRIAAEKRFGRTLVTFFHPN